MCVDWTELLPEIVESISKRLTIYVDYLCFRCVCRCWQSSVPDTPLHLPPQPPWLMLSHRGSFFDLSTGKTNLLNLPLYSRRTRICGSSHGWLVIHDETSEEGYDSWVFPSESHEFWEDAVYHNGSFFAVSRGGLIARCDVEGSFPPPLCIIRTTKALEFSDDDVQYVVFSEEHMLLVNRILEQEHEQEQSQESSDEEYESNLVYSTVGFEIFKMEWNVLIWEKLDTLGERALFIGRNSSFALSAADFDGCCADCIYFTDDYSEPDHNYASGKHDFGIFRLCDKSIDPLPYPRNSYSQFEWPLPVWVTPNPC